MCAAPASATLDLFVDSPEELMALYKDGAYKAQKPSQVRYVVDAEEEQLSDGPAAMISRLKVAQTNESEARDPILFVADDVIELVAASKAYKPKPEAQSKVRDEDVEEILVQVDQEIERREARKVQDRLQGVIFVPDDRWIESPEVSDIRAKRGDDIYDISYSVGFADGSLQRSLQTASEIVEQFISTPIDLQLVNKLVEKTKQHVRKGRVPFTNVYAPPQTISEGVLFIVVRPALVEEIQIAKSDYFDSTRFLKNLRRGIGEAVDVELLEEDMAMMSLHPDRQLKASFSPGTENNTTIVNIDVDENRPWGGYISRSNTGQPDIDREQYVVGVHHNNLWGLDHRAEYQYLTSADRESLEAHNFSYTLPFDYDQRLKLKYAQTETDTEILDGSFSTTGEFESFGLEYQKDFLEQYQPFDGYILSNNKISLGLDYKNISGDVLFTLFGDPIGVGLDTNVDVVNLTASYEGVLEDPFDGMSNVRGSLTFSPGDATSRNTVEKFEAARADTEPQYAYLKLSADRRMPFYVEEVGEDPLSINTGFSSQLSANRLLGSERFVNNSAAGFRGFASGSFSGDSGVSMYAELETPSYNLISNQYIEDSLQGKVFLDYAFFYNNDALEGEVSSEYIASIGAQLNYVINDSLSSELILARDLSLKNNDERQTIKYRLLYAY